MSGSVIFRYYPIYCFFKLLAVLCFLVITGCANVEVNTYGVCNVEVVTPAKIGRTPYLFDIDYTSLNNALGKSIAALESRNQGDNISVCGRTYTVGQQHRVLSSFRNLLRYNVGGNLHEEILKEFDVCQVLNSQGESDVLATGYFQPRFKASREFIPPFIHPLYKWPADLVRFEDEYDGKTISRVGRKKSGEFVPYWTRREIETQNILKGQEILYLADPFDAFVLHVQGSGLAEFDDGSVRQVLFDGTNGRDYRSIGRLLVDEGVLRLEEVTLPKIRTYLQEHLDDMQRILHYNDRYVFFHLDTTNVKNGPIGSMGVPLTPKRSIALDNECFPEGGLYFLESLKPQLAPDQELLGWEPFSKFVLHQDTGAAIKGSGRLDFFWGNGEYAEVAAGVMKQPARLYLIIGKEFVRSNE